LINSLAALTGSNWGFHPRIGRDQVIDAIAHQIGGAGPAVGFALDLAASGLFIGCGLLARKGLAWVFVVGMVLYGLDGLLFLLVGDWFGLAFHVFVLFCLFKGLQAARGAGNNTSPNPGPGTTRPSLIRLARAVYRQSSRHQKRVEHQITQRRQVQREIERTRHTYRSVQATLSTAHPERSRKNRISSGLVATTASSSGVNGSFTMGVIRSNRTSPAWSPSDDASPAAEPVPPFVPRPRIRG
jgi:hypothetical protein